MFVHRHRHPEFWLPRRKPGVHVDLNEASGLTAGISALWFPTDERKLVEHLSGIELNPGTGCATVPGPVGLGRKRTTGWDSASGIPTPAPWDGDNKTALIVAQLDETSSGGWEGCFVKYGGAGGSNYNHNFHLGTSRLYVAAQGQTANHGGYAVDSAINEQAMRENVFVSGLTYDSSDGTSGLKGWFDGKNIGSYSTDGAIRQDLPYFAIGAAGSYPGSPLHGWIYMLCEWARVLGPEEIACFSSEPFSIVRPRKVRRYYEVPTGGPVAKVGTDTAAVSLADSSGLLGVFARSDALALSLAETTALTATLARSDALALSLAESAVLAVTLAASDTLGLSLLETATLLAALGRSDSLGLALAESSALFAFTAKAASDALVLSLAEQAALAVTAAASDALAVTTADTAAIAATLGRSDALALAAIEARDLVALLTRSDALDLALSEAGVRSTIGAALRRLVSLAGTVVAKPGLSAVRDERRSLDATRDGDPDLDAEV